MSMITRLFLIAIVLLLIVPALNGQVTQPLRYEKPQRLSDDYFTVYGLKEEGVALFRNTNHPKDGKQVWEVLVLDTLLQSRINVTMSVSFRYQLTGYDYSPGAFHLLFRETQNPEGDLMVFSLDLETTEIKEYEIKPDLELRLTHFFKVGTSFVFGGYVNNEPNIILYETRSGQLKVLPGFLQQDVDLVDVQFNANGTFNVVLVDRPSKPFRKLVFKTFDPSGRQLLQDEADVDPDRTLQSGVTSRLVREDLVVTGTWGNKNSKQSQGFFVLPIDPFKDHKIRYYYTAELEHFLDFMNPKRAERIRTKTRKAVKDERSPDFVNYLAPYDLLETNNGFALLTEMYMPSSVPDPSRGYGYGLPYPGYYGLYGLYPYNTFYRPSDPYRRENVNTEIKTEQIAIVSFDPSGKLTWDASFECDNLKWPYLRQQGTFLADDHGVVMMYKHEEELHVKTMMFDEKEARDTIYTVRTGLPTDEIRSEKEFEGGLRRWYDNVFYMWGYETIRNQTLKERTRDVFYVNRVVVESKP